MTSLGEHPPVENVWAELAKLRAEIERLRELDTASTKRCHSLDKEIERLNIRIRHDAEAALRALDEIDQLTGAKAALQEEIERLRALDDKKWTEHVIEREELRAKLQACETHKNGYLKEVERLQKICDGTERRESEYLALIEKKQEECDKVWTEHLIEREDLKMALIKATAEIAQFRKLLQERNDEIARLRGSNTKLQAEMERLRFQWEAAKREAEKWVHESGVRLGEAHKEIARLRAEIELVSK
jgi:chromosome segregation ATPase